MSEPVEPIRFARNAGSVFGEGELWDAREVMAFLGIGRNRLHQLQHHPARGFPQPVDPHAPHFLWRRHDIERWAEARERAKATDPDLWGTDEVAAFLGVNASTVHRWLHSSRHGFPRPAIERRNALFRWRRDDIERWATANPRRRKPPSPTAET